MIVSMSTAHVATAERFERRGTVADAFGAARARDEFARWLGTFFDLDPNRTNDLVLALNEALANSAEHAYASARLPGTTDVVATYDPAASTLNVVVSDRGGWRTADSTPADRSRGRGIPLMTALSDRADITTSVDGTHVSLSWVGVQPR